MPIQRTNHNPTISDQNEIRENTMFDKLFTNNMLRLLSGAACLILALALLQPAALADDECGLQTLPGTAETVTCNPGDYAGGITYSSLGDLTLQVPDDTVDLTVNDPGINVTGNGADSIFWDSSAFTDNDIRGTAGVVLDYSSDTGDIGIDIGGDIRTAGTATHAVRATSNSGNVAITTTGEVFGTEHGIQAETGGTGDLTITAAQRVEVGGSADAVAIDATTGTGLLTVDIVPGGGLITGRPAGTAIRTNAGGDALVNIAADRIVSVSTDGTALDLSAAGETTVNNAGRIDVGFRTGTAIRAAGGTLVLDNQDSDLNGVELRGTLDFSGLTGGYTFNNSAGAIWDAGSGASNLGAGVLNNAGTIRLGGAAFVDRIGDGSVNIVSAPGTSFIGTGDSTLNIGLFLNGTGQSDCASATLAGCLDLRGGATDGQTSVLVRGRFTTLVTGPLTTVTTVNPGIALIDVGGGASEADDFVLHPDSVLVQADGDGLITTAVYAEDPIYGAVLDTSVLGDGSGGIFDYALLYNPDTQQHLLASVPQAQAIEYVSYIGEAMSIWHTTTDTIVGRQAALRDGATGKLWARYVGDSTDYDASPSFTTQGNTFVYDQPYSLDTQALIIGLDLISGDDRAFGVHGGLVDSRAKFDETGTSDNGEGITAGLYGAWWHESGLSLDGAVNLNSLTIDHTVSGDFESGDSDVRSLGARLEAGWRLPLMKETLYVQPLATAAYVTADFDDVDLRDNTVSFEGTESSRAGLGARVGGAINLTNSRYQKVAYWATARAWEEYADEDETRFATRDGGHLSIIDDRSGSFEEVDFGVELTNKEGNINVHFAGGVKFGDQIDSSSHFSIGARLNW